MIEKHANEYLDADEAAHKRDKEGLKSALDKHEELKKKAIQAKTKEPKSPKSKEEAEFDSTDKEMDNPVAETESVAETERMEET